MRGQFGTILAAALVSAMLVSTGASADQERPADASTKGDSAQTACMDVGGMKAPDRQAIREFMRSERGPEMMGRMMEMARGMGNGDVTAGMSRMMDMMGSSGRDGMRGGMGGMMGGQGGMMKPGSGSK